MERTIREVHDTGGDPAEQALFLQAEAFYREISHDRLDINGDHDLPLCRRLDDPLELGLVREEVLTEMFRRRPADSC